METYWALIVSISYVYPLFVCIQISQCYATHSYSLMLFTFLDMTEFLNCWNVSDKKYVCVIMKHCYGKICTKKQLFDLTYLFRSSLYCCTVVVINQHLQYILPRHLFEFLLFIILYDYSVTGKTTGKLVRRQAEADGIWKKY